MKGNMSQSQSELGYKNAEDIRKLEQKTSEEFAEIEREIFEEEEEVELKLKGKADISRKVNGQTLENDVNITEIESANKLKTARTINGVAFDGTSDIKVFGECELPMQSNPIYASGWYRFAQITSSSTTAVIRIARTYGNGYPEVYTVIMNSTYEACNFVQLSSQGSINSQYISKIRAVFILGTIYLEFYYNSESPNSVTTKVSDITLAFPTSGFSSVAFETGSIPEGHRVEEFDLSLNPLKVPSLEIGNTTLTETQLKSLLALLT